MPHIVAVLFLLLPVTIGYSLETTFDPEESCSPTVFSMDKRGAPQQEPLWHRRENQVRPCGEPRPCQEITCQESDSLPPQLKAEQFCPCDNPSRLWGTVAFMIWQPK